jgi:hypothetical protein
MTSPSNASRAGTPTNLQVEASSPESVAADEVLLVRFATAITDIKAMEKQVWKLWKEELCAMLPEVSETDSNTSDEVNLEGASFFFSWIEEFDAYILRRYTAIYTVEHPRLDPSVFRPDNLNTLSSRIRCAAPDAFYTFPVQSHVIQQTHADRTKPLRVLNFQVPSSVLWDRHRGRSRSNDQGRRFAIVRRRGL